MRCNTDSDQDVSVGVHGEPRDNTLGFIQHLLVTLGFISIDQQHTVVRVYRRGSMSNL